MPTFVPREWQTKCLERDHEFRRNKGKIFRIDACPGAGKSTMAAMLAASWLNDDELSLDHVLVAAPWKSICQSMAEKFNMLGLDTRERFFYGTKYDAIQKPPTMEATVTTYQEISTEETLKLIDFWKSQYDFRFALISDEIHHTRDELGVWGEFSEEIAKRAERVCVMSGTWFRGDGSAIRHVEYDSSGQAILDYKYPYITGVMDGVVRGVTARFVGGTVHLIDHERNERYERSLDDITGKEYGEAMREIFHPESPVMRNLVEECWLDLQHAREKHKRAAALFVCRPGGDDASEDRHVHQVAKLVKDVTGVKAEIITHKDKDAEDKIKAFRNGAEPFLVAINMISEGVDIPRIRSVVYCRNVKSEMQFRQIAGRAFRKEGPDDVEAATLYLPKFGKMADFAEAIDRDAETAVRERTTCDRCGRFPCECPCNACGKKPCRCICPVCFERPCICPALFPAIEVVDLQAEFDGGQCGPDFVREKMMQMAHMIKQNQVVGAICVAGKRFTAFRSRRTIPRVPLT